MTNPAIAYHVSIKMLISLFGPPRGILNIAKPDDGSVP